MNQKQLFLTTTDRELVKSLKAENISGIKVSYYTTDSLPPDVIDSIGKYIIRFAADISVGLFTAWLYDYIKRNSSHKTYINGKNVSDNYEQISILIKNITVNNYIEEPENHKDDDEITKGVNKAGS